MPEATLDAVADHGVVRGDTVTGSYADARATLDALAGVGIDYDDVVRVLEEEGVQKFEASWTELLDGVTAALKDAKAGS
jgi:transaldolase